MLRIIRVVLHIFVYFIYFIKYALRPQFIETIKALALHYAHK